MDSPKHTLGALKWTIDNYLLLITSGLETENLWTWVNYFDWVSPLHHYNVFLTKFHFYTHITTHHRKSFKKIRSGRSHSQSHSRSVESRSRQLLGSPRFFTELPPVNLGPLGKCLEGPGGRLPALKRSYYVSLCCLPSWVEVPPQCLWERGRHYCPWGSPTEPPGPTASRMMRPAPSDTCTCCPCDAMWALESSMCHTTLSLYVRFCHIGRQCTASLHRSLSSNTDTAFRCYCPKAALMDLPRCSTAFQARALPAASAQDYFLEGICIGNTLLTHSISSLPSGKTAWVFSEPGKAESAPASGAKGAHDYCPL